MAKEKTSYVCEKCGADYNRWMGQCKECKEWNTIVELKIPKAASNKVVNVASKANNSRWVSDNNKVEKLSSVNSDNSKDVRLDTGKPELNRVLGGGISEGSLILLSGSPGAGKSTILVEVAEYISKNNPVFYVTGEESKEQIRQRAKRLNLSGDNIDIMAEVEINNIVETIPQIHPKLIIIDSIQTLYNMNSETMAGSVSTIKEVTSILNRVAKDQGIAIILVCHINKDGNIAGPKALEHMVDVIAEIDNDSNSEYRIIRASKNRLGEVNEVGVFMMTEAGMESVDNPSELFISSDRSEVSGTSILSTIEGNRSLLIELQSLVSESEFNYPKRLATGLDLNRLNMLIAIMNKHGGIRLVDQDVYVSAVGGIKITDTASDLPLAIAIASAYLNKCAPSDMASFGEMDLTGRLRPVQRSEMRIKEAVNRGFKKIMIPKRNIPKDPSKFDIDIIGVSDISDVIENL